ncbi:MBL fold metallo-hydrolase [Aureispira anguillae]|uniref:MBL fold metallo-hydrolase n=1 Tax=Aureispira anguillae TaxID=2864201 RepID=A0A916DPC5_9BACT|nr:MBL fold metallo-hydrolase [Aureispira anguillae]BDS10449.1 MBL fold metallo-hydrolase [Aureispira anguillae]
MQHIISVFLIVFCLLACEKPKSTSAKENVFSPPKSNIYTIVLGNVQDAGYPQIGCMKACCKEHWNPAAQQKSITALGLVDAETRQTWLFEASPDFKYQTKLLSDEINPQQFQLPNGIFLTHGHIGHYVGLMHLGREAMSANKVPVYAMPRMKDYLETSGPWSQLVALDNIALQLMKADSVIQLTKSIQVTPFLVPHRGEYTETVGYKISSPNKKILFIPDIDKWHQWKRNIKEEILAVDVAFLDATFFKNGEVGNRDMSEIPHPFVEESMRLFEDLPASEKAKIHFIHFNHTNPILQKNSNAKQEVLEKGYKIAEEGLIVDL